MRERQRQNEDGRPAAPASAGDGNLGSLRQAGRDLLSVGDEAISRALSGDSEKFLSASRQQGGQ